jgi:drug/metabolite transporter (DMT)-like permease
VAALIVLPISIVLHGFSFEGIMVSSIFALGYSSIFGVFGGYLLAFYIIKRFGATSWANTFYLVPIIATVGGKILLREQITTGMLIGMVLISTGITLIQYQQFNSDKSINS